MRDLETIRLAIEAAATGHLVFSTLHTQSAAKTIDRIIEVFPVGEQAQIRSTLADSIRAVISQALFKRIDMKGRIAVMEDIDSDPGGAGDDSRIQNPSDSIGASDREEIWNADPG